jgi:uncharacterized membrane protein (UPF0136 family)
VFAKYPFPVEKKIGSGHYRKWDYCVQYQETDFNFVSRLMEHEGIYYFFKLIKRFFSEELAFYSSLILLTSIWFAFSRKSMPDTFCMSLVIIGIYHGFMYLYDRPRYHLIGFLGFSTLAVLSKIPALYLLSILLLPMFDSAVAFDRKRNFFIAGTIVLAALSAWYFYWVPHLLTEFGFQLYFPRNFAEGNARPSRHPHRRDRVDLGPGIFSLHHATGAGLTGAIRLKRGARPSRSHQSASRRLVRDGE